jgi:phage-related protein
MPGINLNANDINTRAGVIAQAVQKAMNDVVQFKFFLDGATDPELIALGMSSNDVGTIKSAFTDLAQLAAIYSNTATLVVAKDFRAFARRVWGMGDV